MGRKAATFWGRSHIPLCGSSCSDSYKHRDIYSLGFEALVPILRSMPSLRPLTAYGEMHITKTGITLGCTQPQENST